MTSSTRAFFAGVGTTFVILGAAFGGGLMMARTALEPHAAEQARAPSDRAAPMRVILPAYGEPAPQPPSLPTRSEEASPSPQPTAKEAAAPGREKTVDKADNRKAEAQERDRLKRSADRKARRLVERAKRQQQKEQNEQSRPPIVAFGGDEPRQSGGNFFGN